jgi:peptidoglycan/LPS O-acetylase OafA/YrhL
MASNWFLSQPTTFNAPIWSVSAEIAVYFIFFALARAVRLQLVACVAIALSFWIVRRYASAFDTISPVITCAEYFFIGATIQRFHKQLGRHASRIVFITAAGALVMGGVAVASGWGPSSDEAYNKLAAVFDISLLLLCVTAEDIFGHARFAKLAPLGELTYSTYLLHFPIQLALVIIADELGLSRQIFLQPGVFLLYFALVFYLGHVAYRRFELPTQRFIRARMIAPLPATGPVTRMWSTPP